MFSTFSTTSFSAGRYRRVLAAASPEKSGTCHNVASSITASSTGRMRRIVIAANVINGGRQAGLLSVCLPAQPSAVGQ
jgi:hypothetical protein